jgi:hypothetical protein
MCEFRCLTSMLIAAALGTGLALAEAQQPNSCRDDRILPGGLGLPATNTRSSEPFVTRIYKTDDNDQILKKQPKVKGRKVEPKVELPAKWVVEVIGGGGKVQEVLGEFPTFRDASYCSVRWSEDHPDDFRLPMEREVATTKSSP